MSLVLQIVGVNAQMEKPLVHILTTGGTIASQTQAASLEGDKLVGMVPGLTDIAQVRIEEFSRVGSSKLTPTHWLQLVKRIYAILLDDEVDGVVITHGTDSMEETAFLLSKTVSSKIPIVLTGSMRASNELSADGSANLLNAVRVAASAEAKGYGTMVALNEQIFAGENIVKVQNRRTNAFEGRHGGELGVVYPDTVVFHNKPSPRNPAEYFDLSTVDELPKVGLVQDYIGLQRRDLDYQLNSESEGLVIASFAGGRLSVQTQDWINDLDSDAKPVAIASSVIKGRIVGNPHFGRPVLLAPGLKPNKARVLLMLGVAVGYSQEQLMKVFAMH